MASLAKDKGKRGVTYRVLFKAADGQRKPIRLGPVTAKQATTILGHIDHLERCLIDGSAPPTQTAAWLADSAGDVLRAKLAAHGLAASRVKAEPAGKTLVQLVDAFKSQPAWAKLKPNSVRNQQHNLALPVDHFGAARDIKSITEADGEDYFPKLTLPKAQQGRGLKRSTAEAACSVAYRVFKLAIKSRWLDRNPFEEAPRGKARRGNNVHVPAADVLLAMEELPNSQWRLLVALSRWSGLRVPSEPRRLTWDDIDWDRRRFLVHSSKTEHREGHETRWVPIFPELAA